jgi:hypothetical protein
MNCPMDLLAPTCDDRYEGIGYEAEGDALCESMTG